MDKKNFGMNSKLDEKIKGVLSKVGNITDSDHVELVIYDTYKEHVILYISSSEADLEEKDAYNYSYGYINSSFQYPPMDVDLDDIQLLDNNRLILPVHYTGGEFSFIIGFVILTGGSSDNLTHLYSLLGRIIELRAYVKEIRYIAEVYYLKLENYSKLYSLIDIFQDIMESVNAITPIHMTNVGTWALKVAGRLKFDGLETAKLYISALLHDIGKVYVSNDILSKDSKLTEAEYDEVKKHSIKGYYIVKAALMSIPSYSDVPEYIKYHHEWYDGNGYPSGLAKNDIPYISQVIAVCDAVDAMMSKRIYNNAKSNYEIIAELKRCSGTQFNPGLVELMCELLTEELTQSQDIYIFDELMFLSNISVSFYYKDYSNFVTYKGNFDIKGESGRIILHDKKFMADVSFEEIYSLKMMIYDRNKLYQFAVEPGEITGNTIAVKNLMPLPNDKTFSVYWTQPLSINETITLETLMIGANSLVFEIDTWDVQLVHELKGLLNKIIRIELKFNISNSEEVLKMNASLVNEFNFGNKNVYIISYRSDNDRAKDMLYRYVFRKSMELNIKRNEDRKIGK